MKFSQELFFWGFTQKVLALHKSSISCLGISPVPREEKTIIVSYSIILIGILIFWVAGFGLSSCSFLRELSRSRYRNVCSSGTMQAQCEKGTQLNVIWEPIYMNFLHLVQSDTNKSKHMEVCLPQLDGSSSRWFMSNIAFNNLLFHPSVRHANLY